MIYMTKHIIITHYYNRAFVFTGEDLQDNKYKYTEYTDEYTGVASLNAVIDVLENIPEDSEDLHILHLPECLRAMIQLDNPAQIRDNGYRTDDGLTLSDYFVDLMCYANELRAWLTTQVVRFKPQGSQLLYKNEIELINKAWDMTKRMTKPILIGTPFTITKENVDRITEPQILKSVIYTDKGYLALVQNKDDLLYLGLYDLEEEAKTVCQVKALELALENAQKVSNGLKEWLANTK